MQREAGLGTPKQAKTPRSQVFPVSGIAREEVILIEVKEHDLLIVGAGAAGLRAAIAAAEADPEASIAVVSKVYPMRSHTVSAAKSC